MSEQVEKGRNNDAKLTVPAELCARTVLSVSCGQAEKALVTLRARR